MNIESYLYPKSIDLLRSLIETPSLSGGEDKVANIIEQWLASHNISTQRSDHNILAFNQFFDENKPTILLCSHHDTVKPNKNYTNDPYKPIEKEGKIYGLGSNDAGGCLVSLMALFLYFYKKENLLYNLTLAAVAEEETSGDKGLRSILTILPAIDFAIVGEPTEMHLAISEKGLLVVDGYAKGVSGHVAHDNTANAIYEAVKDIEWIRNYEFPLSSSTLGKVKISVTQIDAGTQHNVMPAQCHFVIDARINDQYTNREVFEVLDKHTNSQLVARSFKHNSSFISADHPYVLSGIRLGRQTYGSPTLSDQSALNCPSVKIGPGSSHRSHIANEFIYLEEIKEGIALYIKIIEPLLIMK